MAELSALRQFLHSYSGVERQVTQSIDCNNGYNNERGVIPERITSMSKPVIPIGKIRNVVAELLPAGHPSLTEVARQLGVSPRTLQRRLADNDLTHSQVVNQTRIAKACLLLGQQTVHISDIAREAGFATPSAFSRAFQTWTGKSPRAYRNSL